MKRSLHNKWFSAWRLEGHKQCCIHYFNQGYGTRGYNPYDVGYGFGWLNGIKIHNILYEAQVSAKDRDELKFWTSSILFDF